MPVDLAFPDKTISARQDVASVLRSPVFSAFAFSTGKAQYADGILRNSFPGAAEWHTLLGKPEVHPVTVKVPVGYGYVLNSRKSGRSLAVVDVEFLQKAIFQQIPKQEGKLVIAFAENTTTYTSGDATECCAWGTHGVDEATGNSFALSSYLRNAPSVVKDQDIQPLTQQLAEFLNDPLHDPLFHGHHQARPGNHFPPWMRLPFVSAGDQGPCGGSMVATDLFLLEPTDTSAKNEIPASEPYVAGSYHLQNAALLPWYTAGAAPYSFPDAHVLPSAAVQCPAEQELSSAPPKVAAIPVNGPPGAHKLIGYWEGYGKAESTFPLRDISPQWDVIIVAFAAPAKNAPEGTMQFHPPIGTDPAQFKADVKYLQSQGKKVMVSLGGGGEHFTLADAASVPNYVSTVTDIVREYGFDGVDIDFESPSLALDPGDTDFRHPTTPSVVNLIGALRQIHDHFGHRSGQGFMISLVPEGTQIPGGYPSYGGQFGSYLPITWAIRDILSFVDVQDYNTPPLQGLDGEIYQPGSVDYHAAMTELLLHGFNVGGDPRHFFPPLPANKVAVGFLNPDTTPAIVSQAMEYIITGKAPVGTEYRLRNPSGYPGMLGAMFWTINDDRRSDYNYSNTVGPLLHRLTAESR